MREELDSQAQIRCAICCLRFRLRTHHQFSHRKTLTCTELVSDYYYFDADSGFSPCSARCRLSCWSAKGSFAKNFTSCDVEHSSFVVTSLTFQLKAASQSIASHNNAGKSLCEGFTLSCPDTHRLFHNSDSLRSLSQSHRISIANFVRSRSTAVLRFSTWLRFSLASAVIPVGMCFITTPVSTLFRLCPPGPDRLTRVISTCFNNTSAGSRAGWVSFFSDMV